MPFRLAACRRALLLSLMLGGASAAPEAPLRVCLNETPHWPWRLADAQGRSQRLGLDYVFLDLLARRTGLTLQISQLPWKRCLSDLKSGDQDAVFSLSHLPERDEIGVFPRRDGAIDEHMALRRFGYAWYVRRDSAGQWDGRLLTGLGPRPRIAAQPGFAIGIVVREFGLQVEEGARTTEAMLQRVLRKQLQAAVLQVNEADRVLLDQPEIAQGVHRLDPSIQERTYYVAFSHPYFQAHRERALQLWQDMVAVRDSAAYQDAELAALRPAVAAPARR